MVVTIKISYMGKYKQITGKDAEELEVPETMKEASENITDFLNNKYKIIPPFTLLVNGMHIIGAIKKGIVLKGQEEFNLIPFMSSG